MKYLCQLPQNVQNRIRQLIKAYYDENGLNYDADIDEVMNQKIVDIMYLNCNDEYLTKIDEILKQYV